MVGMAQLGAPQLGGAEREHGFGSLTVNRQMAVQCCDGPQGSGVVVDVRTLCLWL